jgi:hypothetical protein
VPLATIKQSLLDLKAINELHRVQMLLTNCTFDGVVANPLQVMQEFQTSASCGTKPGTRSPPRSPTRDNVQVLTVGGLPLRRWRPTS